MRPLIWAHRGASGYAPENTLPSFQKAVDLGADGIELDVQLTKDGQMVICHDETVDRTSNGHGWIKDKTFDELRRLSFGKNYHEFVTLPSLDEVLALIRPTDLTINIELKNGVVLYEGLEEKVIDAVNRYDMADRVLYSSFNHYSLVKMRELLPEAYIGFLYMDGPIGAPAYAQKHGGNAIHPALYNLQYPGVIDEAKSLGLDINVWTVNEPEHMALCQKLGVHAIFTNYPNKARAVYGEEEKR